MSSRVRQELTDDKREIGIFLTISPVRHSNRRYSSIIKNRDLLHKNIMVPITTHSHVKRKSIGRKNRKDRRKNRKDREE